MGFVDVKVICEQPADHEFLRAIRQWSHQVDDPVCKDAISSIQQLPWGGRFPTDPQPRPTILVASADRHRNILNELAARGPTHFDREIILRTADRDTRAPSASRLLSGSVTLTSKPLEAVRKSILRLRTKTVCVVRAIASAEDFQRYFELRYRVWSEMGYLSPERRNCSPHWEVDYTDRTALHLGAFRSDGAIVGCARLVFPLGEETPAANLIRTLIARTGDETLRRSFEYPRFLTHPYDMLESFPGFKHYYHDLVLQGLRKAEVSRVIVAPEHRNHGLGEALVDSIVSVAEARRTKILFLACHRRNSSLYARSGFAALPGMETDSFANVNSPAIAMDRRL